MRGIARLAKELGISTGTVSRALNGRAEVSDATKELVLAAAKRSATHRTRQPALWRSAPRAQWVS